MKILNYPSGNKNSHTPLYFSRLKEHNDIGFKNWFNGPRYNMTPIPDDKGRSCPIYMLTDIRIWGIAVDKCRIIPSYRDNMSNKSINSEIDLLSTIVYHSYNLTNLSSQLHMLVNIPFHPSVFLHLYKIIFGCVVSSKRPTRLRDIHHSWDKIGNTLKGTYKRFPWITTFNWILN